jgi:hypothetical protein
VSLKKPSELFEQRRNQSLVDELAQKKKKEELEPSNKRIISPKELFGVEEEVQEEIIEEVEVGEEIVIDPYLEEIELLRNNLERVSLSIPEETDLTKVFQDIQILRNRIDNIPNQKDYSGDIESIREELVRIEGSIPLPEVFDASDLYENISALKNKLEEVRSEIPTIPEPILYDYQLDQLKEMVVDVRNSIPVVPEIRYYENSDKKLKTNIITISNALDKVLSLRGVEYDRVDSGQHQIGVIAQEVEKVIPEVVYGLETKSVAYGNLIALLIEAIKEQNIEIQKLKEELHQQKS